MFGRKRHPLVEKIGHYLTAFVIVLKGVDKAEHFHEHPLIPIFLFLIGGFIAVATFFHHWFEKHVKEFKSLLFVCEGVALALVSYYYFAAGKKLLPSVFLCCSILYFVMAYVFYIRKMRKIAAGDQDHLIH